MTNPGAFDINLTKIDDVVITKAGIENNADLVSLEKGHYQFNIQYGFTPGINLSAKKIRIIFNCVINTLTHDEKEVGIKGNFDIAFIFGIENLQELVVGDPNDSFQIDKDLMASLANIVYSTSRGIILTRCQGTILKSILLPIMSTERLVEMLLPQ